MNKSNKVWSNLFSPPCPKCGSTKTKEELRDTPAMCTGTELLRRLTNNMKGIPNKPIRTWECLDCGSIYDEKGRHIIFANEKYGNREG